MFSKQSMKKTFKQLGLVLLILTSTPAFASDTYATFQDYLINDEGAQVFLTFCAGCHGTHGFASYYAAPSFAMGDRLNKSDFELLRSVLNGKGAMPPWQDKLPETMLRDAIVYLRVMNSRLIAGIDPLADEPMPEKMFYFKPNGEEDPEWWRNRIVYE